ncbi:transposase [Candidatus Desantisbacteria bacterium]|nr:transposase [Candidatus Desantisbacteria bacterium]
MFIGNTQDPVTFTPQIKKVAERFGNVDVTFVGDRGMIKSKQIEELGSAGFHYITAITKPQIEKLLKEEIIQMELFQQELAEIKTTEGVRYVLRRNPMRAEEIKKSRQEKLEILKKEIDKQNQYGCYILKTDLSDISVTKEIIHNRYKDIALVETAFRSSKTVELELRPIHVRLATRTRGHAFVVMAAYRIINELSKRWKQFNLTVQEGIDELASFCAIELSLDGVAQFNNIPEPRESVKKLLDAANVRLPKCLPCSVAE